MHRRLFYALSLLVIPLTLKAQLPEPASEIALADAAGEPERARIYRTNAERREAGGSHEITPWLELSSLLELEGVTERRMVAGAERSDSERSRVAALQLGLELTLNERLKGELVLEVDSDDHQLLVDEALISWEMVDGLELEFGKLYTPFGEYISHFVTGPMLEIGETRADSLGVAYAPAEWIDLSLAAYRGRARPAGGDGSGWSGSSVDWAAALEAWPAESIGLGLSWQSDLADSDARLLEDEEHRYAERVAAVSGFLIWTTVDFEITFEALSALDDLHELDPDRNRPSAWNLEFVHFVNAQLEWALRAEGSDELEDEPERQYGAALTWRPNRQLSLTVEYLRGEFAPDLAVDDEDEPYDRIDRAGLLLSIAF